MANTIQIKRSSTPGGAPGSLAFGELAINYNDGKLFYKNASGTIVGTKLIASISGTVNQITVTEVSGAFTFSLPNSVYVSSLFIDNIEIDTTGATLNQILKFNGTKFIPVDNTVVATLNDLTDVVINTPFNGELLQFDGTNWVNSTLPTAEPMGHEDRSQSNISFNNSTRTFTIAPNGNSYTIWCSGKRYIKTTSESVTIPATSNLYYIYYNSSGVLSYKTTFFSLNVDTPVAYIYWNNTDNTSYFFADERHGIVMDWQTHEYLHRTRGAAIASGFGANGFTTSGTGSSNADAKIDIADGVFYDEDIQVSITHSVTPVANTWQQRIQGGAYIPVFYLSGTNWKKDVATQFPMKTGTSLVTYNLNSGGTWSTPDLGNNKFGISWILATNNLNEPIIAVMGQSQYNSQGEAEGIDWSSMNLSGLPIFEFRPLYKVVIQTASAYTNTPKARFVSVIDIRRSDSISSSIPTTPVSDHGSLTGLSDDDHLQYLTEDRHNVVDHSTVMSTVLLSDISDISVGGVQQYEVLSWSGTQWVNLPLPSPIPGPAGPTGPTGAASNVTGPTGIQGPTGSIGLSGATGPTAKACT